MTASVQTGQDVTALFRDAWPRHAAKLLARATGAPFETARNWTQGRARIAADALLAAADEDDALRAALIRRLHAASTTDRVPVPAGEGEAHGGPHHAEAGR